MAHLINPTIVLERVLLKWDQFDGEDFLRQLGKHRSAIRRSCEDFDDTVREKDLQAGEVEVLKQDSKPKSFQPGHFRPAAGRIANNALIAPSGSRRCCGPKKPQNTTGSLRPGCRRATLTGVHPRRFTLLVDPAGKRSAAERGARTQIPCAQTIPFKQDTL